MTLRAWIFPLAALLAVAAGLSFRVTAAPPSDLDDLERILDREAAAQASERLVRENCLICHSGELITTSRLTPKQWKAEVEKMVGWGTPLPKEQQDALIAYLAAEYPATAPPARPARMAYREAVAQNRADAPDRTRRGDADRGARLYATNCANCHGGDGQGAELGPNLVERPVLTRTADYAEVVRKGRGRMPGFAPVLDPAAEADTLAWLRDRRYVPAVVK